jgi:hypothetical protein
MKRPIKKVNQYIILICLLCWLACFCGLLFPPMVIGEKSVADEIISLNVKNEPLGEVLEDISIAASCQFSIDESWEDYHVTVAFENEPLYRGLKKIFRNVNNAVIFGADRTIKIIIYGEVTSSNRNIGHSVTTQSFQESPRQSQPFSEATASQPEEETSEDIGSEDQSQTIAEPASGPNEADAENMKDTDAESGEAADTEIEALEPTTNEDEP